MEEITINDYIRRINLKITNQLTYTIIDREDAKKMLTVRLNDIIAFETELIRDGSLYYHIIPGKNIKLIYEDFM